MMTDGRRILIVTLICLAVVAGVLLIAWPGSAKAAVKLLAHAGAGIQPPLEELGATFTKKTGIRVEYSYKGSGCLLPDIAMSEKGDLYIPGELFYMQQAVARKYIAAQRPVAQMTTVLIAQRGNPKKIRSVRDLARPGLRVGLGDAKAIAIGRAAHTVLDRAKVRKQVEKNVVMSCLNVVELANAVELGHLDAAIVWDGTAKLCGDDVATIPIPAAYRETSTIPVGVLRFSKHAREARQFMDFLASKEAEPIFRKHGYSVPQKTVAQYAKGSKP